MSQKEIKVKTLGMTRVPFGVSSSPFLLAATVRHHLKQYEEENPKVVRTIRECLYVDDFISGADSSGAAEELCVKAREIMASAGMDLCKWKTNSPELQQKWSQERQEQGKDSTPLKVLGLVWKSETDEFVFEMAEVINYVKDKRLTKRAVLQTASRIFDPIGFLSPFIIRAKIMFQEMWERGLDSDEELPMDLAACWKEWCEELQDVSKVSINRRYDKQSNQNKNSQEMQEIHVFCDASERAYCATAYLRTTKLDGTGTVSLISAKTKVAPLKRVTLPRLELLGALIGARLGNCLSKILSLSNVKCNFWTNSMITIHWIKSTAKQWKPFVANRVAEIQSLTLPENWRHCKGKENPADHGTRGLNSETLAVDKLWWNGPSWLHSADLTSAEEINTPLPTGECIAQNQVLEDSEDVCSVTEPILKLKNYSSLNKLLRVTAWVMRFVHNLRNTEKQRGELCAQEIEAAEKYWIRLTQVKSFSKEM